MKIGEIIAERYKLVDLLGEGGTSAVYLAENIVLNNLWAIKVLSKSSHLLSFDMEEIEILKNLSHPMLPRIADLTEDKENYYIVMDYISGSNLLKIIDSQGKVPEKILLKWTEDLLGVLMYLHSRIPPIIYRDLKPANIIVDDSGTLRLVDFGTARYHTNEVTEDTVYIGTQGYAAPEQYGIGQSDQRTDLFNLGMTIIHLATGIHPVKLESERKKDALKKAGISQKYIRYILKLTQTDRNKRFQTCDEAISELSKIIKPEGLLFKCGIHKKAKGSFKGMIGIASVLPGSGVTSLCLNIGKHLADNKVSSVLVELNSSGDFERIRAYLDELGEVKMQNESRFEVNNLTFYPHASDLGRVSRKGVDAIILDLGHLNSERKISQLNHSDIRIILCPCVPWKFNIFSECNKNIKSPAKNEWIYAASNLQRQDGQKLKKLLGCKEIVLYSTAKNPFYPSAEEQKCAGDMFDRVCRLAGKL